MDLSSNDVPAATFPAHAASPRWIAEEVNLAGDEVALSLEKELESAYATFPARVLTPRRFLPKRPSRRPTEKLAWSRRLRTNRQ